MSRNSRKSRASSRTPARPSHFVFSVALFLLSTLVFIHQCLIPIHLRREPSRFLARPPRFRALASPDRAPAPRNWFHPSTQHPVPPPAASPRPAPDALDDIPDGPLPLPALRPPGSPPAAPPGASWTGSLARGVLSALPLHWLAEAIHAAPPIDSLPARSLADQRDDSIFAARRKGAWIGCERPFHLVCKGVYRAIKKANAVRLVDVQCQNDTGWLPHILNKLRAEFRIVHLTCVVPHQSNVHAVKTAYADVNDLQVVVMDPFTDKFPEGTDMLVAYNFLQDRTLIDAMRFFKNIQKSGTVEYLATETFPGQGNEIPSASGGKVPDKLRINTALAPFWFPPAIFQYENEDENSENVPMRISAVKVEDLFRQKNTPGLQDLVDPRKRLVQE